MTAIPQLLPAASQPIAQPYLTPAQFTAFPTWLDLDNLVPGGLASLQTDALADVLLAASDWANDVCEGMTLSAHLVSNEQVTVRAAGGRITLQPRDIPVTSVTALSYGWDPSTLSALSLPCPSLQNVEGRVISFRPGGTGMSFVGPAIQFGPGPAWDGRAFVQWSYVAGFPSTTLSLACAAGANSVTVTDPAGIMPGATLRIYDEGLDGAGASEALTVSSTYVPAVPTFPPTATSIPLAANTAHAHAAGTGITGMPRRILQAVIAFAVALLMREDVSQEEPPSGFGPAARTTGDYRQGGAASGLVNDAIGWLQRYRPVWR